MNSPENEETVENDKEKNSDRHYISSIDTISNIISNILPKNYISESIVNLNYMSNIINNIFPQNYISIISESILPQTYMSNLIDSITNVLPKNHINTMSETLNAFTDITLKNIISQNYISNILESITNNISNICYTDTIKNCVNEIIDANIDLNKIIVNSKMINAESTEIADFSDKERDETLTSVKEIINISKKDNAEQLIYNKLNEIKEAHPLVFGAISQIFWIIISVIIGNLFTQGSNNYYIQNYTINNNVSIVEDKQSDFIENARYVIAEKLNVRTGPSKDYDIIYTLKYGDVLKVQSKTKYWTKILYKNVSNDILIEGWVYTRYIEEFDIELLKE